MDKRRLDREDSKPDVVFRDLRRERSMGMVLVTHNFGVVADICDRVAPVPDPARQAERRRARRELLLSTRRR